MTGAVNDPRVMYWEPAKWVARLRATGAGPTTGCCCSGWSSVPARTSGPSGRYGHLRYEAEVYAWVLDTFERSDSR